MFIKQFGIFCRKKVDKIFIFLTKGFKAEFKNLVDNERESKSVIFLDCVMNNATIFGR